MTMSECYLLCQVEWNNECYLEIPAKFQILTIDDGQDGRGDVGHEEEDDDGR